MVKQQILFYDLTRHPGPGYSMFSISQMKVKLLKIRIKCRLIIQSKLKLHNLFSKHMYTLRTYYLHMCTQFARGIIYANTDMHTVPCIVILKTSFKSQIQLQV